VVFGGHSAFSSPGKSGISNDQAHPRVRGSIPSLDGSFGHRRSLLCVHPTRSAPSLSSLGCCPPNISSILTDYDELRTPWYPGRAGRLINRPVTVRTIPDFKHPHTGCTTLLWAGNWKVDHSIQTDGFPLNRDLNLRSCYLPAGQESRSKCLPAFRPSFGNCS